LPTRVVPSFPTRRSSDLLVVTVPIVIWIMIGYFETTPLELEEAALIDGATRWQVFRHVALPIARPGLAVAFILAVIFSWNNFVRSEEHTSELQSLRQLVC